MERRSVVFNPVCFFLECEKSMVKVLCFKVYLSSPLFGVLRKDSIPASLLIGFPKTEKRFRRLAQASHLYGEL